MLRSFLLSVFGVGAIIAVAFVVKNQRAQGLPSKGPAVTPGTPTPAINYVAPKGSGCGNCDLPSP